ncbi:unnamed protein product [Schistosoma rodhaini]|nr:unnamed protein product [Schistosoma rodhaini]
MGYLSDRRKKLVEQVLEWNSSRLDLFELTIPDEKCEFNGVMRFFLQDENRKFRTKCIRVSSSSRTSEVAEVLKEKFCIQEPSVMNKRFGIYEHHPNGVRRLTNDEYPLLVQLSWSKLGREGKFVLKLEPNSGHIQKNVSEIQNGTNLLNDPNNNSNVCGSVINSKTRLFPRLWSFRREKITSPMTVKTDERRKQPLGCAAGVGLSKTSRSIFNTENSLICLLGSIKHHGSGDNIIHRNNNNKNSISPNPDTLPNSSFTRTISDPETAMQQKRQRTLEAKFMQMLHHDNIGSGGTLKIYGGQLFPEIPYKTLLISITDNVGYIIRESLNKYGLDEVDPDAYCLVMRKRNSHDILTGLVGVEEILSDDLCPLEYLLTSLSTNNPSSSSSTVVGTKSFGNTVITFEHNFLNRLCLMANPNSICHSTSSFTSTSEAVCNDSTCFSLKVINTAELNVPQHQKDHQNDLDLHSNMNLANSKTENIITTPTITTTTARVNHKPHSFDSCFTVDNKSATYTYSVNDGNNKNNNCPSPQLFDHDNNNTIPSTNLKSTNVLIDSGSSNLVNTIYSVITKTDPPIHNNKPGSTCPKTSVSDRLPCQMAFAPTTLEQLLDWIITKQLKFVHQLRNSHHHTTTTTTTNNNNRSDVTIDLCPLGPAMCVYLMLRAICRQCDRWETIELKQLAKNADRKVDTNKTTKGKNHLLKKNTNNGELALNQLKRRQRHLLSLLMSVIKRFHDFELYVHESIKRIDLNYSDIEIERNYSTTTTKSLPPPLLSDVDRKFIDLIKSVTAWLANASQLLHLITCDIDFNATFKFPVDELCQWSPYSFGHDDNNTVKSSNITTTTSWNQLKEQLAEIVQTAFVYLADLCVLRLDLIAIPQLLLYLTKSVQILSNHHYENCMTDSNTSKDSCFPDQQSLDNNINSSVEINERAWINSNSHCSEKQQQYSKVLNSQHNITLKILSEILNCLHSAYVNPAFIVQLFAHLLHRLNARLFNFIIGYDCEKNQLINNSTHISPIWGKCLYNWIHLCLSDWASAHGLRLATECYLQRISQAADLMLCDMNSVESLYNLTVDLVSLNSRQVQIILENYQLINANNETAELIQNSQSSGTITMDESNLTQQQQIPRAWIEFVVSGVKMVADRILTEENGCHLTTNDEFDGASENPTKSSSSSSRHLEVGESLDLRLPFLLPEDCYPSDNPVPINNNHANHNESIISYEDDGGIYSQSNSFKHQLSSSNETLNTTFITVDSIKQFLYPAIQIGWCRLLIRPNIYPTNDFLFDEKISVNHSPRKQFLLWNVYLSIDSKIPVNCNDRGKDNIDVTRLNKHLVVVSNGFTTEEKIKCKELTLRSLIQSRNDTENNNDSSVTPLKHFQSPKSIYINNASSHTSPDVHIDMKLSIDTNCSNIFKSIHSDHNRKWKYQSTTICQTINNNDVDKISDGFTNMSNDYNLLYKNRSASTNERQCRLFIDASACTGNNNIYDEPSISKYSLCNESFLSTSKLEKSGMRKLSPHTTIYQHHHKTNIINRGNFEQNTFLTRSWHRPKGQSNSFDDRLTISRFTQLSEVMTTSPVASSDTQSIHHKESVSSTLLINSSSAHSPSTILSVQSPANQSFMVAIDTATSNEFIHTSSLSSSTHTSGSMNWLENNNRLIYSTLDTQLNRNTSNCRSSSASSYYPSNNYHTISTTSFSSPGISSSHTSQFFISPVLSSGSKPPKTFVPTACVLPSTNHRNPSLSVPFLTIKTPRFSNSQNKKSRPSRSMNDLMAKSSLGIHQSKENDMTSLNTLNKQTGYSIRRRYTTYAANRFNVGLRPEPLNRPLAKENQFT